MSRLENISRLGFFPLPQHALEALAKLFKPAEFNGGRMLDGVAGEGVALEYLSKAWNLTPYANEYDMGRARKCVEKFGVMQAIRGDFFTLQATKKAFAVNYINPPFMSMSAWDSNSRRSEASFLSEAWQYTARNGYLIFVCYIQHLSEEVLTEMYMQSSQVDFYRVPGLDLGAYGMVIAVCKMKDHPHMLKRDEKAIEEMKERVAKTYSLHLDVRDRDYEPTEEDLALLFEDISTVAEPRYEIAPTTLNRYAKFEFMPKYIEPEVVRALAAEFGPHHAPGFEKYITPAPEERLIQPPMPVRPRQLFSLLASGLLNGLMLEIEDKGRALVRSVTRQVEKLVDDGQKTDREAGVERDDYEDEDEVVRMRYVTSPETTVTVLYESGDVENISQDDALNQFIRDNRQQIMAYVEQNFKALYDFDFVDGLLRDVLGSLKLVKEESSQTFNLLTTQKHTVAAMYAKLREAKSVILCGQMGVGKTLIAASLSEIMRPRAADDEFASVYNAIPRSSQMRPDQFNIVICPPHLVSKHEREILSVSPDAYIGVVRSGEGSKPIVEVMNFIRGLDNAPANVLKVLVISREMLKVGEAWLPSYNVKKRKHFDQLEEVLIDPVTFQPIMDEKKSRNADPKPIPLARLEKKKHWMNLKPGKQPARGRKSRVHKFKPRFDQLKKAVERAEYYANSSNPHQQRMAATYVSDEMASIRKSRREHEMAQPWHGALWQEERSFSALPHNPRLLLQQRMKANVPVLPLPDLAMKHLEEVEYRNRKSPRGPLEGVAKFLAQHHADRIYMVIADECHEYAGDSAQGYALQTLAQAADKLVLMTGTLYKGVASGLYLLEFIANPRMRFMYPWGKGRTDWVAKMGVLERIVKLKRESDGKNTGKTARSETIKEVPGASPELLKEIIDHTIFVGIADLGKALPEFVESGVPVQMDARMSSIYSQASEILKNYLVARRGAGDANSFLGAYFNAMLNWPNYPYDDMEVWHNRKVVDPITERETEYPYLVHTIPGLGHDYVTPKELELVNRVRAELDAGRGVAVYFRQTGKSVKNPTKDILKRMAELLKAEIPGANPAILTSSVSTGKREDWLTKQKKAGKNVLLCNANLVKTGLDLLEYPTILWYELDFSLTTMDQASHRAWRLGQDKPCNVDYLFYVKKAGAAKPVVSEDGTIDITGMSLGDAQLTAINAMGLKTTDLAAHAVADAIGIFMGGDYEYSDEEAQPVRKMGAADTMEAKGVVLMEKKRAAAAFLYGEESASLSGLTEASGSLKDMLAANLDGDMSFDIGSMFKRAAQEAGELDEPELVEEQIAAIQEQTSQELFDALPSMFQTETADETFVTVIDSENEKIALSELEQKNDEVADERILEPVFDLVKDETERQAYWKRDIAKLGKPVIDGETAWFKAGRDPVTKRDRFVCWYKEDSGEYVRQSLLGETVVFATKFTGKQQVAVA